MYFFWMKPILYNDQQKSSFSFQGLALILGHFLWFPLREIALLEGGIGIIQISSIPTHFRWIFSYPHFLQTDWLMVYFAHPIKLHGYFSIDFWHFRFIHYGQYDTAVPIHPSCRFTSSIEEKRIILAIRLNLLKFFDISDKFYLRTQSTRTRYIGRIDLT